MSTAPDRIIADYIATALQRRLNLDESQCFVAAKPDLPPWRGDFLIEVVPGPQKPYGGGNGAQEGGAILREQPFVLWCFYKVNLDQINRSTMLLIEQNRGILDRFEAIRSLFAMTQFPTVETPTSATDFLLMEPAEYMGESPTDWEDPTLKIVRRTITLMCRYGAELPTSATTDPSDYL